eukprot:gene5080-6184_t
MTVVETSNCNSTAPERGSEEAGREEDQVDAQPAEESVSSVPSTTAADDSEHAVNNALASSGLKGRLESPANGPTSLDENGGTSVKLSPLSKHAAPEFSNAVIAETDETSEGRTVSPAPSPRKKELSQEICTPTAASVDEEADPTVSPGYDYSVHSSFIADTILAAKTHQVEEVKRKPVGRIQGYAIRVATHGLFENGIVVLILANCISLGAYDPSQEEDSEWNAALGIVELAFNLCFSVEIIIRVTAKGSLYQHLQSAWNIFDAGIVLLGYSDLIIPNSGAGGLRALRALRALRPLRTVAKVESLRQVADSFVEALPMLLSVVGVLLIYLVLFGICGLHMFMEAWHYKCVSEETLLPSESDEFGCGGERDCKGGEFCALTESEMADGYDPLPEALPGFDNFVLSLLTVFVATTLEGWQDMMYRSMDSTSALFAVTFYILLVASGPFFVVNLFLAVGTTCSASILLDLAVVLKIKFAESSEKRKEQKKANDALLGKATRTSFVQDMSRKFSQKLVQSQNEDSPLKVFTRLIEHPYFDNFFLVIISMNTLCLAMDHYGKSAELESFLYNSNYVLTIMFTVELVLKLLGLGLAYFFDAFNVFDFVIVMLSLPELLIAGGAGVSLTAFRSFRVLRVFKVFKYSPALAKVVAALLSSLASFLSIGVLLSLFIAVFAIIGLHVFGELGALDSGTSFTNIWKSTVTVFQLLTLDNWNEVMMNVVDLTNWGSSLYFVAWVIIGNYIFLSLFLAVVMDAFDADEDDKKVNLDETESLSKSADAPQEKSAVTESTEGNMLHTDVSSDSLRMQEEEEEEMEEVQTGELLCTPSVTLSTRQMGENSIDLSGSSPLSSKDYHRSVSQGLSGFAPGCPEEEGVMPLHTPPGHVGRPLSPVWPPSDGSASAVCEGMELEKIPSMRSELSQWEDVLGSAEAVVEEEMATHEFVEPAGELAGQPVCESAELAGRERAQSSPEPNSLRKQEGSGAPPFRTLAALIPRRLKCDLSLQILHPPPAEMASFGMDNGHSTGALLQGKQSIGQLVLA